MNSSDEGFTILVEGGTVKKGDEVGWIPWLREVSTGAVEALEQDGLFETSWEGGIWDCFELNDSGILWSDDPCHRS